jgi:GDP-mannose 4,6-dehydratase
LFNHESPRRGETFVTRKITRGLANINQGLEECLYMGNIDALRDWGHAKDYVRMQWMMLQQDKPDDFVIATGRSHTLEEFVQAVFSTFGIDWKNFVDLDRSLFRPTDIFFSQADPSKSFSMLGWLQFSSSFFSFVFIIFNVLYITGFDIFKHSADSFISLRFHSGPFGGRCAIAYDYTKYFCFLRCMRTN